MFLKVETTIEFFEENVQQLSNLDSVVMEMARVHAVSILQQINRFVSC